MAGDTNKEAIKRLDDITSLLAVIATKGETKEAAIWILDQANLPPKKIAELLNTTANAVSVSLHRIRLAKKKGFRAKKNK